MHASDHVPVLPAMPRPVMRRRRRSFRLLMAMIVFAAAAALGLLALEVKARYRQLADESFRRAEELFASGAFSRAQQEFEYFRNEYFRDPRIQRAKRAADMSKVAQSIDDELADPGRVIESLDRFATESREEPSLKEQWPVILAVAERAARSRLEKARRSLAANDLESANTWLRWLHDQQRTSDGSALRALDELDQLAAMVREAITLQARRQGFVDAADRALADRTVDRFTEAFRAYDQWRTGSKDNDAAIAAIYERLRQSLRAQVRFEPPPSGETAESVPLLPIDAYTRLNARTQHRAVSVSGGRPVFARVKDLCFALDPATGVVRWVLRVGHDAALPEVITVAGRPAVVVPWFREADALLSLCDAATGETIWSWKAPDLLTGPPAFTRDSLFAATQGGTVWQLSLEDGVPRGVAKIPEPIDSPLAPREDGTGFCVVGARQAVYLFDTSGEQPLCSDLVLVGRRRDTTNCQAMWVPPYVVIFENDLVNRCYVRVLYEEPAGLKQVRQIELDGRVWQAPVLDGADIFVMTDRFKIHCFGLDPGNSAVNLYQAAIALDPPPELRQPTRPYLARVTELPFVAVSHAIYGFRVDRSQSLLREVWNRALMHPDARAVQPIQVIQNLIVAGFQELADDSIVVQCLDAQKGELVWESRLASTADDVAVIRSSSGDLQIIARTKASGMFLLSRDQASAAWESGRMGPIAASSRVRCLDDSGELIFASDAGTRLNRVSTRDVGRVESRAQIPPITSDLASFRGNLEFPGDGPSVVHAGRWVSFVTADRSLELRNADRDDIAVHGVRIPAMQPPGQPWQWCPLLLAANRGVGHDRVFDSVVASHPAGIVCRAELRRTEEITHLVVTECRKDLPPLADAAIEFQGHVLVVGRDGRCVLLDPTTIRTISDWQANGPVESVATDSARLFLVVDRSTVQALEYHGGKLVAAWDRKLAGGNWRIVCVARDGISYLFAFDSNGAIVALDCNSGETVWRYTASAPLALPPLWVGRELVLATIDGGLFIVPDPDSATRSIDQ